MRYIYYVVAIVIVVSALAVWGMFEPKIEISKPYISVNDRIISEDEFAKMLKRKPSYMSREQFIESVIEKQLLIQEAVKQEINKEENFRQSVENFYEQSLIKILLDRKLASIVVDVTDDELERYEKLLGTKLEITKTQYQSIEDAQNHRNGKSERIESEFVDLSDDLKFNVLNLKIGDSSAPLSGEFGYYVYRLDNVLPSAMKNSAAEFDMRKVSVFLQDKKKEQVLAAWTKKIRKNAKIWREK